MSHEVEYYTYKESSDLKKICAGIDEHVRHATYREGGHGLINSIRFVDKVMADYDEAMDYIKAYDRGNYDQLAVKFRRIPQGKTTKKIEDLKEKIKTTRHELYELNNEVPAKSFKAEYVGCRHCGSKINRTYIRSNSCPICHGDMRSETILKKLDTLRAKIDKLSTDLQVEERKLAEKYGEIYWLVKIEYHT